MRDQGVVVAAIYDRVHLFVDPIASGILACAGAFDGTASLAAGPLPSRAKMRISMRMASRSLVPDVSGNDFVDRGAAPHKPNLGFVWMVRRYSTGINADEPV